MAKAMRACRRCHRIRYVDRMIVEWSMQGEVWLCTAKASCRTARRTSNG